MPGGASNEYDDLRFKETIRGPAEHMENWTAQNKFTVEINDTQQGNYSGGQVNFNLATLVSSANFLDWKKTDLQIPVTYSVTIRNDEVNNNMRFPANDDHKEAYKMANRFAMSLKNSTLSLINGIQVECNGKQVVPFQQLSSIPLVWSLMKQWNETDQSTLGPSMAFQKDDPGSIIWDPEMGELNNQTFGVKPVTQIADQNPDYPTNNGRVKRVRDMYPYRNAAYQNEDIAKRLRQPTYSLSDNNMTLSWTFYAKIPFRYLHPLFGVLPLCRSGLWTLTIFTHLPSTHELNYEIVNVDGTLVAHLIRCSATLMNQFCPYMLAPVNIVDEDVAPTFVGPRACTGVAIGFLGANPTRFSLITEIHIGSDVGVGGKVCSILVGQTKLSPEKERELLSNPTQKVVYADFMKVQPANSLDVRNEDIRLLFTANLSKLRGLLTYTYADSAHNGTVMGGLSGLMSPFTTAGNTTVPFAHFRSLEVMVSGQPIWDRPLRYVSDLWSREQWGIGATNANDSDGFRTGLINELDYSLGYGHTYINLARHDKTQDELPTSVEAQVQMDLPLDRHLSLGAFLIYEKSLQIDILAGEVLPL